MRFASAARANSVVLPFHFVCRSLMRKWWTTNESCCFLVFSEFVLRSNAIQFRRFMSDADDDWMHDTFSPSICVCWLFLDRLICTGGASFVIFAFSRRSLWAAFVRVKRQQRQQQHIINIERRTSTLQISHDRTACCYYCARSSYRKAN